jgi:hypothetical protein
MKNASRGGTVNSQVPAEAPAPAAVVTAAVVTPQVPPLAGAPAPDRAAATPQPKLELDSEAAEINTLHEQISSGEVSNLQKAIEIGRKCAVVKQHLKKGANWTKWVENKLKFSTRTANNYILVHEAHQAGKLKKVAGLCEAYVAVGVLKRAGGGKHKPVPGHYEFRARLDAKKLEAQVAETFAGQKSVPAVVIQGANRGERQRSLNQALKDRKKDMLQTGGVILIPPVS